MSAPAGAHAEAENVERGPSSTIHDGVAHRVEGGKQRGSCTFQYTRPCGHPAAKVTYRASRRSAIPIEPGAVSAKPCRSYRRRPGGSVSRLT